MVVHLAELKSVALNVADTVTQEVEESVENMVYEVDNALVTSEVVRHKDRRGRIITVSAKRGEALLHICENLGVCASELVDALLDITYHKAVAFTRDSLEYLVLQAVYVLILVDVYRLIELCLLLGNLGLLTVLPQALVGKAFYVGELAHSASLLLKLEESVKLLYHSIEHVKLTVEPRVSYSPLLVGVAEEVVTHLKYLILKSGAHYLDGR